MIAVRNAMFAEDQSDVQEFFLYVIEEIAKEIDSFSSSSCSAPSSEEDQTWNEIGSGGRKLIIQEASTRSSRSRCASSAGRTRSGSSLSSSPT